MIDSDDVLLLRPAWDGSGVRLQRARPEIGARSEARGIVDVTVFPLRNTPTPDLLDAAKHAGRILQHGGALDVAWYVTEPSPNSFPRLPVREGVQVLVGVALFPGRRHFDEFAKSRCWQDEAAPLLRPYRSDEPRTLLLEPTLRSALRG